MALPLFAVTLFLSAFMLFLVQPIIGKMILPKLGGTPQVWNTCMVFFQMALLTGYFYTHTTSTRLPLRRQLITHALFLLTPLLILFVVYPRPFYIDDWVPNLGGNPIPDTLLLLIQIVGLPFLVVATTAPLLQKWFSNVDHPAAKDPYFLSIASNAGSLAALILYPIAVEPYFGLRTQAWIFAGGYVALAVFVLACAGLVWKPAAASPRLAPADLPPPPPPPPAESPEAASALKKGPPPLPPRGPASKLDGPSIQKDDEEITLGRRLRWIGLAAVPSSFMLAITTHITTDLSPIPLFWLVPLTLYLLSFILVFMKWPVVWVEKPHTVMLIVQPILLAIMIFFTFANLTENITFLAYAVVANLLGFFATALVCHGEMAKDRPSTKHLTEFYLLMSVGGMVGGIFNALIAPIIFKSLVEFDVAIFVACILRPVLKQDGWIDRFVFGFLHQAPAQQSHQHGAHQHVAPAKGKKQDKAPAPRHHVEEPPSYSRLLDFFLPLCVLAITCLLVFLIGKKRIYGETDSQTNARIFWNFGFGLMVSCFFYGRPIRYGLTIGALLVVNALDVGRTDESTVHASRSFYGIIRVRESRQQVDNSIHSYRQLSHGHINHGLNFMKPRGGEKDATPDLSRLATTYYHRKGPAGVVMEQYNWFHEPANAYSSDARMPSCLVGLALADLGTGTLPLTELVGLWSEPPFATIGLGTGTMGSYARPYQHCHFYEIDNHIRKLSFPFPGETRFFTYLQDAKDRGAEVQVLMGDARLRMALPYKSDNVKNPKDRLPGGGPDNFYHMIVVDAFSSDAIPVHLITKEAFAMYFKKLTPDGILCVHTSNRYVSLDKIVGSVSAFSKQLDPKTYEPIDKPYYYRVMNDREPPGHSRRNPSLEETGHYTSTWVMVARDNEHLRRMEDARSKSYPSSFKMEISPLSDEQRRFFWTDDHSNLVNVLRFRDRD